MPQTFVLPKQVGFIGGLIAPSSVLRFYRTGTSTPQSVYTDAALTNAVTSTTADSAGVFAKVYLNPEAVADYRVTLESLVGAVQWTEDNISRFSADQGDIGAALYPATAQETAAGITPTNYEYPPYNVLRYGADPTGVADSTIAFNSATASAAAHTGNDTTLKREIIVPGGAYKLCSQSATQQIFVRKGQHLRGEGMGATYLDFSSAVSNTQPHIVLGNNSSNVTDPGGLPVEVSGCFLWGGSSTKAVIDATQPAGWAVRDCFFSNSGIGIKAGGSDGIVTGCFFDQGLSAMQLSGQNVLVSNCGFYLYNYQITVLADAHDYIISDCYFVYPNYASILLDSGATGIKNINVRDCSFAMNEQFTTNIGFIALSSTGADLFIDGCTFRNGYNAALRRVTGTGNKVVMSNCVIDGDKSVTGYAQSTTGSGVEADGMDVTLRNVSFLNLRGQPVVVGSAVTTTLKMQNCSFSGNTGGTTDISITNSDTSSSISLDGIEGSGRLLFNAQATVPMYAKNLRNWLAAAGNASSRDYVLVPYQHSNVYAIALRVNINSGGSSSYRKSSFLYAQKDNDFSASAKSFVNKVTAIEGAANLNGVLDVQVEFASVGGGTNISSANFGYLAVSWPQAYSSEYIDVQFVV